MAIHSPCNIYESIEILSSFTRSEKKISEAFLYFFKERLVGNHQKTFPKRDLIAKMAKTSLRTVASFIKKWEGCVISHKSKRLSNGKNAPNEYEYSRKFFEFLILLDSCGYLKKWCKNTAFSVTEKIYKNEWCLHEILLARGELLNNGIAHGFYQKLHTIKNYFLLRESRHKDLQGSQKNEQEKTPVQDNGSYGILDSTPLNLDQKKKIFSEFGYRHIKEAVLSYCYVSKREKINNPINFIFSMARESSVKSFRVRV